MELLFDVILPCFAVLILVGCVSFFAANETAYLSITKVMLRQLLKKDTSNSKNSPAKKISFLKKDMDRLLSLILIGINFITTLASGLAATIAINMFGASGATIATIVMSFILVIFGEIVPKTVAEIYPIGIAEKTSGILILLEKIFFPIVWFFSKISGKMTEIMQIFWHDDKSIITEEELKSLFAAGEHEGTLETSEKKMLYRIFDFTDLRIKDIMRHRSLVRFVQARANFKETASVFAESGYSILPVCDGGFENVVGTIHYKDILESDERDFEINNFAEKYMWQPVFLPETLTATELLQRFKSEKINFAVAVDENGSNSGIVTTDDIMKAVFGRSVQGEAKEMPPESRIKPLSPTEYLVPGDIRLNDVNELLKLDLDSENYDTLGGWLLEQFDALPESGEAIMIENIVYKVEDQSQRRIKSVKIRFNSNAKKQ